MTPDETERMKDLCRQIEVEKDQDKFAALIKELTDLLERKDKKPETPPNIKP